MVESTFFFSVFEPLFHFIDKQSVTLQSHAHAGVRASDFVGRAQGKLRDFYRIGKVLGTGKYN